MRDDRLYLNHTLVRCRRINPLHRARQRNIQGIGSTAGRSHPQRRGNRRSGQRVSFQSRDRLPSLDWKAICGMRDVLIHDYIGVDLDEVWNVAAARIPELHAALEHFLAGGHGSEPVP